jgi:5-methylcytosine-specific restriction protein A
MGSTVIMIVGIGSPKRYYLWDRFVIDDIDEQDDGTIVVSGPGGSINPPQILSGDDFDIFKRQCANFVAPRRIDDLPYAATLRTLASRFDRFTIDEATLKFFDDLLELVPADPDAYRLRGIVRAELGIEGAAEDFEIAADAYDSLEEDDLAEEMRERLSNLDNSTDIQAIGGLIVGEQYERPELAEMWGYRDWHAIGRGIVTPRDKNKIILFVTKVKQETLTQYQDHFEGDCLHMEGERNHANDTRLVNAEESGDEIHLFYRERHHMRFTYYGLVALTEHTLRDDAPSSFVFEALRINATANSALVTEDVTHGLGENFVGDEEGRRRYALHVTYERSRRNRTEAIRIHGTRCRCCGFDFNRFYGPDLARDYIEIHHAKSITKTDGRVNPMTDLEPLCSNCHTMAHRQRGKILSVEELQEFMMAQGWTPPDWFFRAP